MQLVLWRMLIHWLKFYILLAVTVCLRPDLRNHAPFPLQEDTGFADSISTNWHCF